MRLVAVERQDGRGRVRLLGTIEQAGGRGAEELYFEYPERYGSFVCTDADAFVPALLLPCMARGEGLEIKPPVSRKLLEGTIQVQDIFSSWYPQYMRRVPVDGQTVVAADRPVGAAVGAFFSLGVDSFYTVLKNLRRLPSVAPPITHLIYMKGIESFLESSDGTDVTEAEIGEVARAYGKELIVGRTNLRSLFPLDWQRYYVGAGLAAVSLSLANGLSHALVPSSSAYPDLDPAGTHPLVDGLWSNGRTRIVHDGCEAGRAAKTVGLIAEDAIALTHLRVCTENQGGAYNCGKCPKCLRTMMALHFAGKLADAKTFPDRLPDDMLDRLVLTSYNRKYLLENLALGRRTNRDPALVRGIERRLRTAEIKDAYRILVGRSAVAEAPLAAARGLRRAARRGVGLLRRAFSRLLSRGKAVRDGERAPAENRSSPESVHELQHN